MVFPHLLVSQGGCHSMEPRGKQPSFGKRGRLSRSPVPHVLQKICYISYMEA